MKDTFQQVTTDFVARLAICLKQPQAPELGLQELQERLKQLRPTLGTRAVSEAFRAPTLGCSVGQFATIISLLFSESWIHERFYVGESKGLALTWALLIGLWMLPMLGAVSISQRNLCSDQQVIGSGLAERAKGFSL